ncbi:MAG: hypothetical protein KDK30_03680 [Leptospiraceae bacterium]|nr:hypothetical protein [Leptospiraceae bacterium]
MSGLWLHPVALGADLLTLKSGEKLEGFFVEETEEGIRFRLLEGGVRDISNEDVERLEVGYPGEPLCYQLKETGEQSCDVLLHQSDENTIVIAEGEGFLKLRQIPLEKVALLEVEQSEDKRELGAVLPQNVKMKITHQTRANPDAGGEGDSETVSGSIISKTDTQINIRDDDGRIHSIPRDDILAAVYQPPEQGFEWIHLIPGVPQFQRGDDTTGYVIAGSMSFMFVGFLWELNQAQAAASAAEADLSVLLFNNTAYREEFNRHQTYQLYMGVGMALMYMYHIYDYWMYGSIESSSSDQSWRWNLNMVMAPGARTHPGRIDPMAMEPVYQLSLEVLF